MDKNDPHKAALREQMIDVKEGVHGTEFVDANDDPTR